MNNHLVSIIIPCYNSEQYLEDTIHSVLNQSYNEWECIIVDDGSTDNSKALAEKLCLLDNRFRLICKTNGGLSSARNFGINHSKGFYILALDSDDKIGPDFLLKTVSVLDKDPNTKLVYTKAERFDAESGPWLLPNYNYNDLLWRNMIFCTALYRKSDYDKTCGYNENMCYGYEDWDFWLALLSENDKVVRIDEVLFYYRAKKSGSMLSNVINNHQQEAMAQLVENHKDLYLPYLNNLIWLKSFEDKNKEYAKEILDLRKQLDKAYLSKSYRLGKMILKPFKWIQSLFNK